MSVSDKGVFLTFEGVEGSGKTTQIERLKHYLLEQGHQVLCTKEPGGTDFGMLIRKLILDPDTRFGSDYTEVLLFIADRLEHVEQVIKPALADGKVVICDRFVDSTVAYQIGGRRMDSAFIGSLNRLVDVRPHRTFLLDLDPMEGIRRAKRRAQLDRFEEEEISFHERVREAYLSCAESDPERVVVIRAQDRSIDSIFSELVSSLAPIL